MKKTISIFLALIMLCAAFSGCGENKKSGENNGGNGAQGTPPAAQEPARTYDTPEQEALVVTAEAYLARRTYLQYDDSRLIDSGVGTVYRTDRFYYTPEDCTRQFTGYSNCAAWTYEVYYRALGIDIKHWTTAGLQGATDLHVITKNLTGKETQEEKDQLKAELLAAIQPGDLINYRAPDGFGHVMMYVGYDEIIHCSRNFTAGNYDYGANKESIEAAGGVIRMKVDQLFATNGQNILNQQAYSVVRPLKSAEHKANAKITEDTANRIKNLQNIYVEKCSSHPAGFTAAPGEEITYTFYIRNNRNTEATVEVIDNVPSNATYVSGAEKQDGSKLSWNVKVASGATVEVKYTVKVNANAKIGDAVYGEGTVGGVTVRCRPTYIGKNLDAAVSGKIASSGAKAATMGAKGLALAAKVYADAGLNITLPTEKELLDGLYNKSGSGYTLKTDSEYFKMLVPTMYGGYKCNTENSVFDGWRTKGLFASQLMAGDIIACEEDGKYTTYMYLGNNAVLALDGAKVEVLDLMKSKAALESAIGYDRFAVVRPAMVK